MLLHLQVTTKNIIPYNKMRKVICKISFSSIFKKVKLFFLWFSKLESKKRKVKK